MKVHRRRRRAAIAMVAGSAALIAGQVGFRSAARADAPSAPGTAAADAAVLGVVPQASSLSLTTSAGQSESAYNQTEDQASSATVDMGGLGVLLANSPVCGQVFFTQQRQPQPLTADSQDGSRTLHNNQFGNETVTVSASPEPEYARATTAPIDQEIPGVLHMTGQSATEVRYTPGVGQEADATVHGDLTVLGGLVSMHGMVWHAHVDDGVRPDSASTFSFGSVTVAPAGVPLTLPSSDSPAQVFQAVNAALATVGLSVSPPVSTSDPNTGSLSITPLDLHFTGSPTDNAVLAPAAAQVPTVEALLAAQTSDGSDCSQIKNLLGNMLTPSVEVANLALASAQGAGGLDVDLGGATVSVRPAPQYANPFGSGVDSLAAGTPLPAGAAGSAGASGPAGAGAALPAGLSDGSASSGAPTPSGSAGTGTAAGAAAAPGGGGGPAGRASPAGDGGPALIRCVTSSPAGGGCWKGLGVVAGSGALAVGLALLAADLGVAALPGRRRSAKRRSVKRRRGETS